MKAIVEEVNKVQRRIRVELTQDQVASAFGDVYQGLKMKANIRGFRPGKAPLDLLRKLYQNSARMDVADHLVKTHLFEAIKGQQLHTVGAPVLELEELPVEGEPFCIVALIDLMPKVEVASYKGLHLTYLPTKTDEEAVDRELEMLRQGHAKKQEAGVGDVAGEGMAATVQQIIKNEDGLKIDQLSRDERIVKWEKPFPPEPFATINKEIAGLKVGEKKEFTVSMPGEGGRKLLVEATVKKLERLIYPVLDDEFAKDLGVASVAELRAKVKQVMVRGAEQNRREQLEFQALEQLSKKYPFEVPPSMVDHAIDGMIDELEIQDKKQVQKLKEDQEYRKQFIDQAKQRVRNTLILLDLVRQEKIEVSNEDLEEYLDQLTAEYAPGSGPEERKKLAKSFGPSFLNEAKERVIFRKAIDFLIQNATIAELPT